MPQYKRSWLHADAPRRSRTGFGGAGMSFGTDPNLKISSFASSVMNNVSFYGNAIEAVTQAAGGAWLPVPVSATTPIFSRSQWRHTCSHPHVLAPTRVQRGLRAHALDWYWQ